MASREQEWDDTGANTQEWPVLNLESGETRVRILSSKPYFFYEFWTDVPNAQKPGEVQHRKIVLGDDSSVVESFGIVPAKKSFVPVWSYKDGKVMILEFGKQIGGQIRDLSKDPDWGSPVNYDLKITKTGKGLDTRYNVVPVPNGKPITKEMEAGLQELGDVSAYPPATPLEVQRQILNAALGRSNPVSNQVGVTPDNDEESVFFDEK